jgi:hypothetical protein
VVVAEVVEGVVAGVVEEGSGDMMGDRNGAVVAATDGWDSKRQTL